MIVRSYRNTACDQPAETAERATPRGGATAEDARLKAVARAYWRLWRRNWRPPLDDAKPVAPQPSRGAPTRDSGGEPKP